MDIVLNWLISQIDVSFQRSLKLSMVDWQENVLEIVLVDSSFEEIERKERHLPLGVPFFARHTHTHTVLFTVQQIQRIYKKKKIEYCNQSYKLYIPLQSAKETELHCSIGFRNIKKEKKIVQVDLRLVVA